MPPTSASQPAARVPPLANLLPHDRCLLWLGQRLVGGLQRDLDGDFAHPAMPPGHPARVHVLYRLQGRVP